MRILFVSHRFPYPPTRGGKIRPFNMIQHLAQNHEVTVASLARSAEEAAQGAGIAPHCARYMVETVSAPAAWSQMLTRLPTPTPSSMGYFYSPRLAARIRAELGMRAYDLAIVHCSSVAQYVADVPGLTKMLDFGDMDSQKWLDYARVRAFPLSLGYRLEGLKLQREEGRLAALFDLCSCTTRAELETLRGYGVATPSGWFPNGVDLDYFQPAGEPHDPDTIAFVGRMDYFPNQAAAATLCGAILPRVQAARPGTQLQIIGADPSPAIRRLGTLPGVTVTGSVPDVRPFVRRAALTVAPLGIARGTQNKILESMAMGVPVVASDLAARGVDAVPGEHLLAATAPEDVARLILRILDSPAERERLARAGRRRVETHHTWPASMRTLDRLIADAMAARASKAA